MVMPPAHAPVLPEGEYDPWPTGLEEAVLARVSFVSPTRSTFKGPSTSASPSPVRECLAKEDNLSSPAVPQNSSQPTTPSPTSFRHRRVSPPQELQLNKSALRADIDDEEEYDNTNGCSETSAVATVNTFEESDQDEEEAEPLLFDHSESSVEVKKRTSMKTARDAIGSFMKYGVCLAAVVLLVWLGTSESLKHALENIRGYEIEYDDGRPKVMWKFGVRD